MTNIERAKAEQPPRRSVLAQNYVDKKKDCQNWRKRWWRTTGGTRPLSWSDLHRKPLTWRIRRWQRCGASHAITVKYGIIRHIMAWYGTLRKDAVCYGMKLYDMYGMYGTGCNDMLCGCCLV